MITALVSKKGGVGKTTTTVNLAAALAGIGKKVLLIDLDAQSSASLSLGVPRALMRPSSADVLLNGRPVEETIRRTRTRRLDLVTASADLGALDQTMGTSPERERLLEKALVGLDSSYDFVLLDCPSSLSLVPINALVASDNFIVPVVPHFLASEGVANLLSTAERLYERHGRRTELLGIVLTMVDYRTRLNRTNVDQLREQYRSKVFAIEIRTNIRLAEAPAAGQTIFEYDPLASGAKAYRLLAAELLIRATSLRRRQLEAARRSESSGRLPVGAPQPAAGTAEAAPEEADKATSPEPETATGESRPAVRDSYPRGV